MFRAHFSPISELKIGFSSSLEGEKNICFTTAFYFHKNVMTSKPLPLMGVIGHKRNTALYVRAT